MTDHGDEAEANANAPLNKKPRPYWTLAERNDGVWGIAFGAYDKADVTAEYEDYLDHTHPRKNLKMFRTDTDDQAAIDAEIAKLNAPTEPPAAEPTKEDIALAFDAIAKSMQEPNPISEALRISEKISKAFAVEAAEKISGLFGKK